MPKTIDRFECDASELADLLDAAEADYLGNGGSTQGLVLWGNGTFTQVFQAPEYGVSSKYEITPLGAARFAVTKTVITPDYDTDDQEIEADATI